MKYEKAQKLPYDFKVLKLFAIASFYTLPKYNIFILSFFLIIDIFYHPKVLFNIIYDC